MAIFAYALLGRGLLSSRYRSLGDLVFDDSRRTLERFQEKSLHKNLRLIDRLSGVAPRKGCTPSQLILALLIRQSENIFVIPGTKSIKYLEDNFAAAGLTVTDAEQQEIRELTDSIEVEGDRNAMFGQFVTTVPV